MGGCCSGFCRCITCGLCGSTDQDADQEEWNRREPLLQDPSSSHVNGDAEGPSQALARGQRKPLNTSNMLGLGIRDVNEDYIIGDLLGEGAFGVVRRCNNRRTNDEFACKTVLKKQLKRKADVEDVRREVQILMMLSSHPNVAALVAIYEDEDAVHMILELCEGGQLFDEICSQGIVSERDIAKYFRKMVEVVHHCHTLGIAHRDIKPENFLLSKSGAGGVVKAADFGLSQFFRPGRPFKSLVGSAYYVAPEVLKREYGPKADIWSLGVCLYILLTGLVPFWGDTEEEIFAMVLHADVDYETHPWPVLSSPAKDIVQRMLQRDPVRRPTAQQLLQHKWLCQAAPDAPLGDEVIQRMRSFAAMTRVKRAAMLVAAQTLEDEGMPQMTALFNALDMDQSGALTADELGVGLGRAGVMVDDGDIEKMMQAADSDGDVKTITASEFVAAAVGHSATRREEFVRSLFKVFDASGSGALSLDDLHAVLSKYGISREDVASVLAALDTDGDGMLKMAEFEAWMNRNTDSLQEAVRRRWHATEVSPQKVPAGGSNQPETGQEGGGSA